VLGTAKIGRTSVNPAIRASRNGSLAAIASRSRASATDLAREAEIPKAFASYAALLDDPEIDAVYIPLPNSLHREWTIRAAEKKKHILCEKPLAATAAECREMQAAADAHGVTLMEAFMYRFHPRTELFFELVHGGGVGQLRAIRSAFSFRLTNPDNIRLRPELAGGALMDVGCYCVNLSRTLAGTEPVEAQAWASWAESGVDAQLAGTLRFGDGLVAQLDCALSVQRREFYEAAGTEASLSASAAFVPGPHDVAIVEQRDRAPETRRDVKGADQYRLMVEHFADCALLGRPPRYGALDAAANMAAIEALYRSARSGGKPVTLGG
jgi:predicted dehydrogenase